MPLFETRRVNKVFSPGIFISKKMEANVKLALQNLPFSYNSVCIFKSGYDLKGCHHFQIIIYLISISEWI